MNKYDKRTRQLTVFSGDEAFQEEVLQDVVRATDDELDEAERQIGYSLPEDYREFLRGYGEIFIGSGILVKDAEAGTTCFCEVTSFYGVNTNKPRFDLAERYRIWCQRERSLPHLLEIAVGDSYPGTAMMSLTGDDRGKIYCYRDLGDEQEICLLANSFDEFIALIDPREEAQS